MADISDVCDAIRDLVYTTLYPTDPTDDEPDSEAGVPVSVMTGWPLPKDLQTNISAGTTVVNVYDVAGTERFAPMQDTRWRITDQPDATYTLTEGDDGLTITVGGAAPDTYYRQIIAAKVGGNVYSYAAQDGDSAATVAAGLQSAMVEDIASVTVSGAVVTIPESTWIDDLRIGVAATAVKEVGRQAQDISINIWAPTAAARTAVASLLNPALQDTYRIALADETYGMLTYRSNYRTEELEKIEIFRTTLVYNCEYGTTKTDSIDQIVAFPIAVSRTGTNVSDDGITTNV